MDATQSTLRVESIMVHSTFEATTQYIVVFSGHVFCDIKDAVLTKKPSTEEFTEASEVYNFLFFLRIAATAHIGFAVISLSYQNICILKSVEHIISSFL